jgi:hypothetical protein
VLPDRGEVEFREAWIAFLNVMAENCLFKVRQQVGGTALWAGVGLNPVSLSNNWSEASAQRITAMLVVWWYFYCYKLKNARQLINKLETTQAACRFPQGKELALSLRRGLRSLVTNREADLDEEEIKRRVERRFRELVVLAKHTGATDEADAAIAALPAGTPDVGPASTSDDEDQSTPIEEAIEEASENNGGTTTV